MKKIITCAMIVGSLLTLQISAYAAKYKSAVSGRYVKSSYSSSHKSTTYRSSR